MAETPTIDLDRLNDLLQVVAGQRDQALNTLANVHADLIGARRELQRLEDSQPKARGKLEK